MPEASLANAVEDFLADVGTRSDRTRVTYRSATQWLLTYLDQEWALTGNSPARELTLDVLLGFPAWLSKQTYRPYEGAGPTHLSPASMQLYLLAAGQLAERMLIRQLVNYSYADLAQLKKAYNRHTKKTVTPMAKKTPTEEVIEAVLAVISTPPEIPPEADEKTKRQAELTWRRNIAIIYTFITSGARVSEMAGLKVADLAQAQGQWGAWITGKRGRTRFLAFGRAGWAAIQAYLQARSDTAAQKRVAPLFCRHDKGVKLTARPPLSVRAYQRLVKDVEKEVEARLGYPVKLTPHKFRHFFARNFMNIVGDLTKLQAALGHSSLSTTGVYTEIGPEEVASAVAEAEPIQRMRTQKQETSY